MAVDMYLNIDGVKGETTDDKHKDWIEVVSYNHGMAMPVSSTKSSAGGASSGRTQHGDFVIAKYIDLASPKLYEAVSSGKHFGKATFEMCRAGGSQLPFLTITMEDVMISNVQQNGASPEHTRVSFAFQGISEQFNSSRTAQTDNWGSGGGKPKSNGGSNADVLPTEEVSLNYGKIEWKYTQQKRKDGSGGGNVSAKVDLTKGKVG